MICSVIIACGIDKKVVLPSSLAVIEDEAFYGTSSIEYVVLPEGVTTIGSLAFADCANLYLVDIPASVTQIEPNAFANSNRVYILTIYDSNAYHYAVEHGIPVLTK